MRSRPAKWLRYAVAGAALLCGLGGLRADVRPDVKVALVVGNSAYTADVMKLKTPARDARDIAAALKADGFDVDLRLDVNEQQFRDMLGDFERKSKQADVSLFYYAGHGMQFRRKNFLLPTDNYPRDIVDVKRHSVALDDIVDAAGEARKAKIVILDACRDGRSGPAKSSTRSIGGLGDGDGLAAVEGADGLVVFFSSQHGKQALDFDGGDHSPFAQAMLRHMTEPGRKLVDVLEDVSHDVARLTNGGQQPEILTASLGDSDIFLNPKQTSAEAWRKVKGSKDPRALKQFMADFPDSPEAETAQAILDNLDAAKRDSERVEEEKKRAAAAEAAIEQLRKQTQAQQEAEAQRRKQEQAEKDAAAKRLAEIEANVKAEHAAMDAKLAEAKRQADEKLAQQRQDTEARLEAERRQADAAKEEARRAEEARARQIAEAAALAQASRHAAEAAETARLKAEAEAALAKRSDEDAAQQQAQTLASEQTRREAAAKAQEARARAEAEAAALAEAAERAREAQRSAEMRSQAGARAADLAEVRRQEQEAAQALVVQRQQEARAAQAAQAQTQRRLDAEAEQKRLVDQACADDLGKLASFRQGAQSDAIALLRHDSQCPAFAAAADKALREIADSAAKTCDLETKALARLNAHDAAALAGAAGQYHCAAAHDAALKLAETARQAQAAEADICAQDEVALAKIDPSLPVARAALAALGDSRCAATRDQTTKGIAAIDERVAEAQDELVRLACLAPGRQSRRFDDATSKALAAYFVARNAPAETVRITQGIVDELADQEFKVCAPAAPPVSAPSHAAPLAVVPARPVAPPSTNHAPVYSARPRPEPVEHVREFAAPSPRLREPVVRPREALAEEAPRVRPARARPAPIDAPARASAPPPPAFSGGQVNIPSF